MKIRCPGVILALAIGTSACGGADGNGSPNLDAGLASLARGSAIYGYSFEGPPPLGRRLKFALHATTTAEACAMHRSGFEGGEFWYLSATASSLSPGTYPIRVSSVESAPWSEVEALRMIGSTPASRYRAASGSMSVVDEADPMGAPIRVSMDGTFATLGVVAEDVYDAPGTPAGQTSSLRSCRFTDGTTQTCRSEGEEDCCLAIALATTGRLRFALFATATYCAAMCTFSSPELASFCIGADSY